MLFFIQTIRSLSHDQEKNIFFHFVTTFTAPWSRKKKVFFHLVTRVLCHDQEKNKFFLFSHYVHNIDQERFFFFSFSYYVHYAMIKRFFFFHFSTTFTTPWSQEKEIDFYCTTTRFLRYDHKNIFF